MKHLTLQELKDLKEIIECLLDCSNASIIKSNFVKGFYNNTINNRLYGSFNLFGAKSFRPTSDSPNLLNIPSSGSIYASAVKDCFTAEKDHIFYIVDLSALEDRVIANLSGDTNKCSIFLDGIDGHCLNSYYYFKNEIETELPRNNMELNEYLKLYFNEVEKGNKILKAIRSKSKPVTFGLAYGAFPPKISESTKLPLHIAEELFNNYHEKLYKDISVMRDEVLQIAKNTGRIHLGLGCYMNTSEPDKEIRTLFNACSQFWSILTLLTINKLHKLIDKQGYQNDIQVICTIYDSIYIHMKKDVNLIKWVNDTIIPLLTVDYLKDIIVHNEANGELGFTWASTKKINNNATVQEINDVLTQLSN